MGRPVVWLVGLAFLFPLVGCRNCDLVEAELRSREAESRQLRDELYRSESYNYALQRELHDLRSGTPAKLTPELATQVYTVQEVVLGRGTGGYDDDGVPGDEGLEVVLEPRDPDGHAIKAPGTLYVEVLQIPPEGVKLPLSSWEIPANQLRRTWRSGLLSTGYFVVLPWKNWPTTSKLRVTARFILTDGRVFEADKDVAIRLPPGVNARPSAGVAAALAPLPLPVDLDVPLPAPDPRSPCVPPQTLPQAADVPRVK
jgi:hypothetical protein